MTSLELIDTLKQMYEDGEARGEMTTMIHLFGIKYAAEIKASGKTPKEIARFATGKESYGTEISKGMKLARYVRVR